MEAKVRKSKSERQGFFGDFGQKKLDINRKWPEIGRFRAIFEKNSKSVFAYSFTLSRYSPDLVFIRISSPSLTNKGTFNHPV